MKRYKRAMTDLPVPSKLIDSTAAAMHRQLDDQNKQHRPSLFVVRRTVVVAAAALLVLIPATALWQSNRLIKTTLTAGEVVSDVVLKNGALHFEQTGKEPIILPEVQFGVPSVEKQLWDSERYAAYLGKDLSFPGIPKGMTLVTQQAEVLVLDGEKVVSDDYFLLYQSEDGQSKIEIHVAKGKLPSGSLLDAAYSSQVGDVQLYVSWSDKENAWKAQFLKEDIGYRILCTGITQEAFIQLLYSVVAG